MPSEVNLFEFTKQPDARRATLSVDCATRSPHKVNPLLYGKFCEHLGSNIYNGMEAQILRNPTFAKWRFGVGDGHIDGGVKGEYDHEKIAKMIQAQAERFGFPNGAQQFEDYKDGAAFNWFRVGSKEEVLLSPDAGPHGGRVQRFETFAAGGSKGLAQWTHLPLHRTRAYTFRVVARAAKPARLELSLSPAEAPDAVLAVATLELKRDWSTLTGRLEIPAGSKVKPDGLFRFAVTANGPVNVVLGRVLLYPADHVHGADPDVIRFLKDARLPLLRWPGGNMVSGYRWREGVGPIDERPTVPNPAWGGLEYHLFGTDEFIAFCRAVGCEPLICLNAGDGNAEEAAAWVEYCNGTPETPLGRLRAANGHREPFRVKYWEIGNEISGRHQIGWTTPGGNVDRYQRFTEAMRKADPNIFFLGCGGPWGPEHEWNRRLVEETGGTMRCVTDHILTGGAVNADTDPAELFHAFLGYAVALGKQYRAQRRKMLDAGIKDPRLALTELQLFAGFKGDPKPGGKLSRETMPTPPTISEALYFTTIAHECARMGDFVETITHSATVNHGGGLRKTKERVWANPVHHAHAMGAAFGNATPVAVKASCGAYSTANKFGLIPPLADVPVLDPLAALTVDGDLLLMLVHRGATCGPVALSVDLGGFKSAPEAEVLTLAGETLHDQNREDDPERIHPRASTLRVKDGKAELTLTPFSLTRLRFPKA